MVRPEPISPERPEQNDEYKFELIKAMGVAIAAIAKEKSVFITDAEVKRNTDDYWELEIKAIVPKDKAAGDEYNKALRKYWNDRTEWEIEMYCEKFNITEEQYKETLSEYNEYCKETDYRNRVEKMRFYESKHPVFVNSPIIEVA
jgi:lipopolysaccharide export LptBFGC system permease protein LptF